MDPDQNSTILINIDRIAWRSNETRSDRLCVTVVALQGGRFPMSVIHVRNADDTVEWLILPIILSCVVCEIV